MYTPQEVGYSHIFAKGIPTPSGRLGPIGIHCDAWKSIPPIHFEASQCIPMEPNLSLTLLPALSMGKPGEMKRQVLKRHLQKSG